MSRRFIWLFFLILLMGQSALAEQQVFIQVAKAFIGDNQTKNEARMLATLEAKRLALEQAGTYVESLTIVKNHVVSRDDILMLTAGVTHTEILEEQPLLEGQSFGMAIKARVTVDITQLPERIQQLKRGGQEAHLLKANQQLLTRNAQLEKELKQLKTQVTTSRQPSQIEGVEKRYQATDLFQKGLSAKTQQDRLLYFEQSITLDPNFAVAHFYKGMDYAFDDNYLEAIPAFSKAIALAPSEAEYYSYRGDAYFHTEQWNVAIADYTHAIELKPQDDYYYVQRGQAYLEKRDFKKAQIDIERALALFPHEFTYYLQGRLWEEQKKDNAAIISFSHALELNPEYRLVYRVRGLLYAKLRQCEKALADYQKACQLGATSLCRRKCPDILDK